MKYTFRKKEKYIGTSMNIKVTTFDQITAITKQEGRTKNEIYDRFLEVAANEYWRERGVKKKVNLLKEKTEHDAEKVAKSIDSLTGITKKRVKRKKKKITASIRRSKQVLPSGMSYCQFIECPKKGQSFLRKNMIKYDDAVFDSDECVEGYKNG